MVRVRKGADGEPVDSSARRKKTRRGQRSEASVQKRRELKAQRRNEAGPSRELLIANRDANMPEGDEEDDHVLIDPSAAATVCLPSAIIVDDEGPAMQVEETPTGEHVEGNEEEAGIFAPLSNEAHSGKLDAEMRRIPIPPHRMAPLKKEWVNIFTPLTEMLGLQVRMNLTRKAVEMRVSDALMPAPRQCPVR